MKDIDRHFALRVRETQMHARKHAWIETICAKESALCHSRAAVSVIEQQMGTIQPNATKIVEN